MNPSQHFHLQQAVNAWIALDLPPAEKESLSPALIEALHKRFDALEPEVPQVRAKIKPKLKFVKMKKKAKKSR